MPGIVIPQDVVDTLSGMQATKRIRKPLSAVVIIENISTQADQVGGKLVYLVTERLVKLLPHLAGDMQVGEVRDGQSGQPLG